MSEPASYMQHEVGYRVVRCDACQNGFNGLELCLKCQGIGSLLVKDPPRQDSCRNVVLFTIVFTGFVLLMALWATGII
jgi:hypothetical protein